MQHVSHQQNYHQRRGLLTEVFKFVGLFVFFFSLLSVVVMGPTIYTTLSYWIAGDAYTKDKSLPSNVGENPDDINNVLSLVEQQTDSRAIDSIVIPKINVDAPIVYSAKDTNAQILEDLKSGVVHYPGTAMPGRVGNVFMTGHSSYYWWNGGQYNQVFALLHNLKAGDLVYLYYKGGKYVYRMKDSVVVNPSDVHVLDQTTTPTLSLMTCTPIGTNLRRLIVRSELISSPAVSGSDFDGINNLPQLPRFLPL